MNILTNGHELVTAFTNLFIFIISVIITYKIKENKKWCLFYKFIIIDSFLGVIVHGIKMSTSVSNTLWSILLLLFVITFNLLLYLFTKVKIKHIVIISIIIYLLLFLELLISWDYIISIITYALLVVLYVLYNVIKSDKKNKKYFIISIIIQILGVVPVFLKLSYKSIDHNAICHTFTIITLILFYVGIKKEELNDEVNPK